MTVYVPCEDPEVLAEWHAGYTPTKPRVEDWSCGVGQPVVNPSFGAERFARALRSGGYRLVFDSPEEAGRALARWVGQGRNVRWQGKDGSFPVLPHSRCDAGIVNALERRADAVHVDAPSAAPAVGGLAPGWPHEGEPLTADERAEYDEAPGGTWEPGDVVAVGDVGPFTVVAYDEATAEVWCRTDTGKNTIATADRVESWMPSPRTERVPWWEAVGRDLAISSWPNRSVEAVSFDEIDGKAWCRTKHGDEVLAEQGQWADADGCVEVLVEETQEAPRHDAGTSQ